MMVGFIWFDRVDDIRIREYKSLTPRTRLYFAPLECNFGHW